MVFLRVTIEVSRRGIQSQISSKSHWRESNDRFVSLILRECFGGRIPY